MNTLVIYDSYFGNTKIVAEIIAKGLAGAKLVSVLDVKPEDLTGVELLVAGSPIRGWKPTENMQKFLESLQPGQLAGVKATTFDTRVRLFFHGDAAGPMSRQLQAAGAEVIVRPESFDVEGKEGPLFAGEVEKAAAWAAAILAASQKGQTHDQD